MIATGRRRILTPEQEQDVVDRYSNSDSTATDIAKNYSVHRQTIQNALARHGVCTKANLIKRALTEEQRTLVAGHYRECGSTAKTRRVFHISQPRLRGILSEHGVVLTPGKRPTKSIDHDTFDVITPDGAYWIGFLFADGFVHYDDHGAGRLGTVLTEDDVSHVEKFRAFLKSNHEIGYDRAGKGKFPGGVSNRANARPTRRFSPRSAKLTAALVYHGMVETKALRAPSLELSASRDFWRGMVDGDGGLGTSTSKRDGTTAYFMLCGQSLLLGHFQDFLVRELNLYLEQSPTDSGIFVVSTTGSTAIDIIRLLYENSTVALERKNLRALKLLSGDLRPCEPYEHHREDRP